MKFYKDPMDLIDSILYSLRSGQGKIKNKKLFNSGVDTILDSVEIY